MAASSLPISRLVNVSVVLSPLAAQAQNLSALMVMTSSAVIDVVERVRSYFSLSDVAADFGSSGPEYAAALLWYQQTPQPTQLLIGRWAKTAAGGVLKGNVLSAQQRAIANFNALVTPAFQIDIDNVPYAIAPASFAGAANLNAVAGIIQTAMQAAVANTTVIWNAAYGRFEVTSGTTGATSALSFARAPTAVGSITFGTNPANSATITLGGTVVTFVTGTPTGNQVQIGADTAATLANLLAFLTSSTDVNLVKFVYSTIGNRLYLKAATPGTGGNALTVAASAATVSGATLAGGGGTDASAILGLAQSATGGGYRGAGSAAETALAAATLLDQSFGQQFYASVVPEAVPAEHLALAGFYEATTNKHIYGVTSLDTAETLTTNTTSIGYQLRALNYKKTVVQYSSTNANAVVSLLARILTTDYTGNNTVITLMYKNEPGIVAESLNSNQMAALALNNVNVFVAYNNGTAIIEKGQVSSGDFVDTITGADALAIAVQTGVFNLLYTSTTRIPQTDAGANQIVNAIENVCSQYVRNGLCAPGVWDQAGFGELTTGDFLPKGFYVYAPPLSSQAAADRAARRSVPIQVAVKLAGAVHTVNVVITVSR
jgi:hypothetical protein